MDEVRSSSRGALDSRRIRALRGPRDRVDPFRAIGYEWEEERAVGGGTTDALTVFLTGAECPFACVFCDLWRYTTEAATPPGAIPAQLEAAFEAEREAIARANRGPASKLYNASNFFDHRAVPPGDDPLIAELLEPFMRVTVECHARLVGPRCLEFAERIDGRLEVALGLETVHPEALPALNKGMTLDDFRQAAGTLRGAGIGVRVFALVGAPSIPLDQTVEWTARTAEFAFEQGADRVSLIPVRGGNGAMEELEEAGLFRTPSLALLEDALESCLPLAAAAGAIVEADLWDAAEFAACPDCAASRVARLRRINLSGSGEPCPPCPSCNGS
jgi:radical SAM enzyme (TIGR01210 family)